MFFLCHMMLLPPLMHRFVVRCFWAPSGRYFVSGSYDKSVCIFRLLGDDSHSAFEMGVGIEVEMIRQLTFKGAVEGIAMRKVMITNYLY